MAKQTAWRPEDAGTTWHCSEQQRPYLRNLWAFQACKNFFLKHFKFHRGEWEVLFWGRAADSSHSVSPFISEETCENFSWLFSSSRMWPSALCQCLTKSKGRMGSSCIILFARCRFDQPLCLLSTSRWWFYFPFNLDLLREFLRTIASFNHHSVNKLKVNPPARNSYMSQLFRLAMLFMAASEAREQIHKHIKPCD